MNAILLRDDIPLSNRPCQRLAGIVNPSEVLADILNQTIMCSESETMLWCRLQILACTSVVEVEQSLIAAMQKEIRQLILTFQSWRNAQRKYKERLGLREQVNEN